MNMHSRIQAEIDLDAMTYNLEHIKQKFKTWNQNHRCFKSRRLWTWGSSPWKKNPAGS